MAFLHLLQLASTSCGFHTSKTSKERVALRSVVIAAGNLRDVTAISHPLAFRCE
jgi:hypothetical protein